MLTSLLWSDSQTVALRPKILRAIESGEPVECPEDGVKLQLDADYSIINLARSVWARCPQCQRTDRFA
jgi:hypothetical protein